MSPLRVLDLSADRMEGEAIVVFFFEDERPIRGPAALLDWRLNGLLSQKLIAGKTVGKEGEQLLVMNNGKIAADWALFVGGGRWEHLDRRHYGDMIRNVLLACRRAGFARIALALSPLEEMGEEELGAMVADIFRAEEISGMECQLSPAARTHGAERLRVI
ncbi:MAG: M17 family peptidase N-terminal domain-containing protein [Desulfuromonadales bacterium]